MMNWLDKSIFLLNPRWGAERLAWRNSVNGYNSGSDNRGSSGWTRVNAPAETIMQGQRDIIRARARDLERNSDIGEAIISAYERNVIGSGIVMQSKVMIDKDTEDDDLNEKLEDAFEEWCHHKNCDITGQQSFAEMQAMAERRIVVDGGILFIKTYINGQFYLQAREVDEIDSSLNLEKENSRIVNGVELDKYNRPLTYYLKVYKNGYLSYENEPIPADRVIFLYKKQRPSQIRELSKLARTATRVNDIDRFLEAESFKARILACLAVFIKKIMPNNGLGFGGAKPLDDSKTGMKEAKLAPGMINYLDPGDSIETVNPSGQASNAREFVTTNQRLSGAGAGLSYEAVSRDMSQVNYSSARQGLLEDQRTYKTEQAYLIEHLCREVYLEWLEWAVLSNTVDIPDYYSNKKKYQKHVWYPSGWAWVDPLKELKANEIGLNTGQVTLAHICSANGQDWRDVLKQRAKEIELEKELGILPKEETKNDVSITEGNENAK